MIVFVAFTEWKIGQNLCIVVKFSLISGFMQISQRIFTFSNIQVLDFFYTKLEYFWHITRLSAINRREVIKSQKQSFPFLVHPVQCEMLLVTGLSK